jgi:hypothetical protein
MLVEGRIETIRLQRSFLFADYLLVSILRFAVLDQRGAFDITCQVSEENTFIQFDLEEIPLYNGNMFSGRDHVD